MGTEVRDSKSVKSTEKAVERRAESDKLISLVKEANVLTERAKYLLGRYRYARTSFEAAILTQGVRDRLAQIEALNEQIIEARTQHIRSGLDNIRRSRNRKKN